MATTILKQGSTGEDVKKLQQALGITADGIFGNQTKQALTSYQKSNGLSADGIYGNQTANSLFGGKVLGASTSGSQYDDPNGGAAGLFDPNATTDAQREATSQFGQSVVNYGGQEGVKTLGSIEAAGLAKQYGINMPGFDSSVFIGKTAGEAAQIAQEKKDQMLGQTSQSTSYSFNPDSIANTKKTADKFQLALDSMTQNPWEYNSNPEQNKNSLVDSFSSQFANSFTSAQDFYDNLQNNPELQKSLEGYIKAGGTPAMIASKIVPVTNDILPPQDTATYLDKINSPQSPEGQTAYDALSVERQLSNEEIARQYNIPNDLAAIYFGTKETIGVLEQQKALAENKKKLIAEKELKAEATLREQAQYEIDKNNADVESAQADIELNRQNAKNYMTGMLAKLGALQTTGAAPVALATLEQKYQKQKQELNTKLQFANRKIQIDLTKDINAIESKRDEDIQSINEDLSKSDADVRKEIFKAQQTAAKEVYSITSDYAKDMRTQTDKYKAESKANSDKYISSFMTLAGKGVNLKSIPSMIDGSGRIDTTKLPASIFGKSGSGSNGFTPTQLLKLQAGGIDPSDKQAAAEYLFGSSNTTSALGKPTAAGEELKLGEGKTGLKVAKELESAGATSADIVQIQQLLNQGYSLKSIASSTGMPTSLYNAFNKYIIKGGE